MISNELPPVRGLKYKSSCSAGCQHLFFAKNISYGNEVNQPSQEKLPPKALHFSGRASLSVKDMLAEGKIRLDESLDFKLDLN